MKSSGLAMVLLLVAGTAAPALAAPALPVVAETEPNDEPLQGASFTAPALLSGSLPKANDQDAYRWLLSDADAQKLWTLDLTGMPEALTGVSLIRLQLDDEGTAVTSRETLLTFGIRDGSRPVRHEDLLLPAGELFVGVFGAGQAKGGFRPPGVDAQALDVAAAEAPDDGEPALQTAYRVAIEPGSRMAVDSGKEQGARGNAQALRLGYPVNRVLAGEAWYRFEVPQAESAQRYTVDAAIDLSRNLVIELHDSAGAIVEKGATDRFGKVALRNLVLEPGTYFLRSWDTAGGDLPAVRRVGWRSVGAVTQGEEQEPNPTWEKANQVDFATPLQGVVEQKGENDYFRFDLEEGRARSPLKLTLASPDLQKIQLCLVDRAGVSRQCRSGAPPLALTGLVLNPGVHGVLVARAGGEGTYTVELGDAERLAPRSEQEPNDKAEDASLFGKGRILKGTLSKQDTDHVLLLTTQEPQLWRLQAIGKGLHDLRYWPQHGEQGQSVRAGKDSRRLRLDNLFLLPGQHRFTLDANQDTSYVLRALPLGPPSKAVEREPNNGRSTAHGLRLNHKAIGLLTESSDVDWFRFYLAAAQPVSIALRPAPDAGYRLNLYEDGGQFKQFALSKGQALEETLWLEPGDYYFSVSSAPLSEAEYEVQVDQLGTPARVSDREPNDTANYAAPWPGDGRFSGRLRVSRAGADYYRLPERPVPLTLTLPALKGVRMAFVNAERRALAQPETDAEGRQRITLPPATEGYLHLSGAGSYDFQLQAPGVVPVPAPEPLPLAIDFPAGGPPLAAYSDWQQNLAANLTVRNTGTAPLAARLSASTTDDRWQLALPEPAVNLAAGASIKVPMRLTVAPDAWPDEPVLLRVRASDERGRLARSEQPMQAQRQVLPIQPSVHSPVPERLRGHINVALAARGASWVADEKKNATLNDGRLVLGDYFRSKRDGRTGPAVSVPVLKLAGDRPVPVTGFSLHPFGLQDGQPAQRNVRDFAIDLSEDGQIFETVLTGRLSRQQREQFFALPTPRSARFARLRLLSATDDQLIALGEWKVLAAPPSVPSAAGRNIAARDFGGHVVWMSPPQPSYGYLEPMLEAGPPKVDNRQQAGYDAGWVIGFHHNRAARIDRITWENAEGGAPYSAVEVLISENSPLGPWTSLGDWTLDGDGEQTFTLPAPAWARFVKFDVADTAARTTMRQPLQIKVFEALGEHGSILGEWGYDNPQGPFEQAHPERSAPIANRVPEHTAQARALTLRAEESVNGVVQLGAYDNWYRLQVPQGHNQLALTLAAVPLLRAQAVLLNSADEPVPLDVEDAAPDRQVLVAQVTPGEYFLKVSEPPRSVVFTWDTSGSTGAVRPIIRQAVMNYVADVRPDLDEARMLPFGGGFLSRQWLDQPYMLQSVLNDYNGAGDSSAAETAIVQASRALKQRPGQRVIVLITDAATNSDRLLWPTLKESRPRVIALGVSSRGAFGSNPPHERDLMQDWAMAGDGYYEYVENVGGMERAFDRASAKIREPASYRIAMATRFEPEPEPGALQVVTAPPTAAVDIALPARTIEIVLDASGSMLKRLDGKRRYRIARDVLTELADKQLPDSVNLALRVFGHQEPGSCRTDIVLPPAPLDRKKLAQTLASITPQNLARTPIAASIEAAASDLSAVAGDKLLLLITDGEETCDGDVDAALQALNEGGVEVTLNIVGFALADSELEATFARWAEAAGGSFQSAGDESRLADSVRSLTARAFTVRAEDGTEIARGQAGDPPLPLKPGNYLVAVAGTPAVKVTVGAGQLRKLTISD